MLVLAMRDDPSPRAIEQALQKKRPAARMTALRPATGGAFSCYPPLSRELRAHVLEPAINRHRRGIALILGTALPMMFLAVRIVRRWLAAPAVVTDRPSTRIGREFEQGSGLLR